MKIAIWINSIFGLGGTKRVVSLIANELAKNNEVTIVCNQNRFVEDRSMYHLIDDVKVVFMNLNSFKNCAERIYTGCVKRINNKTKLFNHRCSSKILMDALLPKAERKKLVAYFNGMDFDVIIATAYFALYLGIMGPELNAKTVGWQHNCYDGYLNVPGKIMWQHEEALKRIIPRLDKYVVLSEYDQRDYKKYLNIDTVVKLNPRSFVSKEKASMQQKHFLMATRYVYAKGLDLMVDAFEKFAQQDSEWDLNIIGSGELFGEIDELVKQKGLEDRIHLLGYTKYPQQYYLQSSVFLLPSRWEGWPMVIMEAYEYGLPVLAFKTGAMDLAIIDQKTGLLCEAFDTQDFANAMTRVAHDDEFRNYLSQNALIESKRFDIEAIADDWQKMLQSL